MSKNIAKTRKIEIIVHNRGSVTVYAKQHIIGFPQDADGTVDFVEVSTIANNLRLMAQDEINLKCTYTLNLL